MPTAALWCGWDSGHGRLSLVEGNLLCQDSSVTQLCPTLCDPMNHSMPGLPVHHQLPEFTQTHVHQVSDAIQPSHPLSSPSPPALNISQHQGLFKWVSSSHQVAKVLEFQLQHHSLQRNPRADLLQNGLVGSPCSPRDPQESSPTPQFKIINSLALSLLHRKTYKGRIKREFFKCSSLTPKSITLTDLKSLGGHGIQHPWSWVI